MRKAFYWGGCCVGALMITTPALAQSSAKSAEEIIVTARKRTERLQDVPVSVTAVSGDNLDQKGITNPADLSSVVPNLQVQRGIHPSLPIFSIRGVSLSDQGLQQSSPVALYFDEVYKGTPPVMPVGLYDVERVEVLRGPQGTLYGKNSTGGAINIITRKPGYDTEGYLSVGYGNFNRFEVTGAVQTALGSKMALRVAGTLLRTDGFVKNKLPGYPDLNGIREYGVRASLLFEPSDDLSFILRGSRSFSNPYTTSTEDINISPLGIGRSGYTRAGLGHWEIEQDYVPRIRHSVNNVALTGKWRATDDLEVTSITGYDYGKLNVPYVNDGSPVGALFTTEFWGRTKQFTQDLRVASSFGGPFDFILGAYYSWEDFKHRNAFSYFFNVPGDCQFPRSFNACRAKTSFSQVKKSWAIYSDASYNLTSRLVARGGLRFTRDVGNVHDYNGGYYNRDGITPVFIGIVNGRRSYAVSDWSGKAGLDFKITPDKMLYVSYNRGFRGAAFSATGTTNILEVGPSPPETLVSYEAGFKTQWLDRTLTLNGAVYHYIYKNQQIANVINGVSTITGLPKSRINGAELELTYRPVPAVTINAGLGLSDSKVLEAVVRGRDLHGFRLPNFGKWTGTAGINWDVVDSERGKITVGVDGFFSSKVYYGLFMLERISQHAYGQVNAQLRFRSGNDRYGLTLWGRNLTNEYHFVFASDTSFAGYDSSTPAPPRTFGATLDVKF